MTARGDLAINRPGPTWGEGRRSWAANAGDVLTVWMAIHQSTAVLGT